MLLLSVKEQIPDNKDFKNKYLLVNSCWMRPVVIHSFPTKRLKADFLLVLMSESVTVCWCYTWILRVLHWIRLFHRMRQKLKYLKLSAVWPWLIVLSCFHSLRWYPGFSLIPASVFVKAAQIVWLSSNVEKLLPFLYPLAIQSQIILLRHLSHHKLSDSVCCVVIGKRCISDISIIT